MKLSIALIGVGIVLALFVPNIDAQMGGMGQVLASTAIALPMQICVQAMLEAYRFTCIPLCCMICPCCLPCTLPCTGFLSGFVVQCVAIFVQMFGSMLCMVPCMLLMPMLMGGMGGMPMQGMPQGGMGGMGGMPMQA